MSRLMTRLPVVEHLPSAAVLDGLARLLRTVGTCSGNIAFVPNRETGAPTGASRKPAMADLVLTERNPFQA